MNHKQNHIKKQIRISVYIALFSALMIVGTYIKIPAGPVPVVFTNFFILLAGMLLGWKQGLAAVGLYLLLGALGFPVFSGGGGFILFAGPTGGYLLGYLPAVFLTGFIYASGKPSTLKIIAALSAGIISIYLVGVPWLKIYYNFTWIKAFTVGMLPFLPGDIIKGIAAFSTAAVLQKYAADLFPVLLNKGYRSESN